MSWTAITSALALAGVSISMPTTDDVNDWMDALGSVPALEQAIPADVQAALDGLPIPTASGNTTNTTSSRASVSKTSGSSRATAGSQRAGQRTSKRSLTRVADRAAPARTTAAASTRTVPVAKPGLVRVAEPERTVLTRGPQVSKPAR